jgi:arabinan endo-1,5-alpha-L-arabinosidase
MFYCFYGVTEFGTQTNTISIAMSKTLQPGSWTDHEQIIQSGNDAGAIPYNITNAINPAVLIDPANDLAYLNYGSFFGDVWQLILSSDLFSAPTALSAVQISIDPAGTSPEEGSFMNYHGDWYYLWFSHAISCGFHVSDLPPTRQDYDIRVGRSRNATRLFVDMDGAALDNGGEYIVYGSNGYVYAPGGQGVLTGECSERKVLYYHYCKSSSMSSWGLLCWFDAC